jgi:hypothetical protein
MSESYEVGTRAWQPDPNEGWVPSEVEEKIINGDKVKLVFRLENGDVSVPRSLQGTVFHCTCLLCPLFPRSGLAPSSAWRLPDLEKWVEEIHNSAITTPSLAESLQDRVH